VFDRSTEAVPVHVNTRSRSLASSRRRYYGWARCSGIGGHP